MLIKRTGSENDWVDALFVGNEIIARQEKYENYDYELYGLVHEVSRCAERVKDEAQSIRNKMENILNQFNRAEAEGYAIGLNSLGELQSRGPSFDVSVAVYETKKEQLEVYLLKHYSGVVEHS